MDTTSYNWDTIFVDPITQDFVDVKTLSSFDPNYSSVDSGNLTAWEWIIYNEWEEGLLHLLEQGHDPNMVTPQNNLALNLAIAINQVALVEMLVENGANPNIADHKGENGVASAIANWHSGGCGNEEHAILECLLALDLDLSLPYNKDQTLEEEFEMCRDELSLLPREIQFVQHFLDRYQAKKQHEMLHNKTPTLSRTKPTSRF